MSPEVTPKEVPEAEQAEGIFQEDGSLNESFLTEHYGLGPEEALQPVNFGNYSGTVAQMLADERCPVGGMVHTAYGERGIEGVAEQFKALGQMDPKFSVAISERTLQREETKIPALDSPRDEKLPRMPDNKSTTDTYERIPDGRAEDDYSQRELLATLESEMEEPPEPEPSVEAEQPTIDAEQQHRIVEDELRRQEQERPALEELKADASRQVKMPAENQTPPSKSAPPPQLTVVEGAAPLPIEPIDVKTIEITASDAVEPETVSEPGISFMSDEDPVGVMLPVGIEDQITEDAKLTEPLDLCQAAQAEASYPVADWATVLTPDSKEAFIPAEPAEEFILDLQAVLQFETADSEAATPALFEQALSPEVREVSQSVMEALRSLKPAQIETVQSIMAQVEEAAGQVLELQAAGEDIIEAQANLEAACLQLFEQLGLDYDEATTAQFAQVLVMVRQIRYQQPEAQASEIPLDKGTHEYKLEERQSIWALAQRAKQTLPLWLGRWAIEGSLKQA